MPAAQHFHGQLKIYAGVPAKCADAMRAFGIRVHSDLDDDGAESSSDNDDLPALVIHDTVRNQKLIMPHSSDGITAERIIQFWTDFLDGNVAHLKQV